MDAAYDLAMHRLVKTDAFERVLTFPILVAMAFAVLVSLMISGSVADPDIWWHLRNAESLSRSHAFLTSDSYSFTAFGASWINHEWLGEIPFYLGWRTMGDRGVAVVTLLAIESVMLGVFHLAYRRSRNIYAAALVSTVAALLATVSFGPRTLLFGWLFLVLELMILERLRSEPGLAWALPALFAVWVNTHGSWMIGMVLLWITLACGCVRVTHGSIHNPRWAAPQRHRLAVSTALSMGALFLNPYGARLVAYPLNLALCQQLNIANVEEWHPLDLHSARGSILLICVASVFGLQLLRSRLWALDELACLTIGIYAALLHARFLFLAAILVMPLMAKDLPGLGPRPIYRNRPWLNAGLILLLVIFFAAHLTFPRAPVQDAQAARFPTKALPFLRNFHPEGNVFNEYTWGGYLEWHARQVPVMIDSRADIFEYNGTLKDYLDAIAIRRVDQVLDKYKIRYVLFERDAPLVTFLLQTPLWEVDYDDGSTVLLERCDRSITLPLEGRPGQ